MKRVAVLQSNYLPWKGYFDIIAAVDEFIVYDCVQYTKNDWRNRNQIKTAQGKAWLTVPVSQRSLHQTIEETEVADPRCFRKHWNAFRQNYARSPHIQYCVDELEQLYEQLGGMSRLSEVNVVLIRKICSLLGIRTTIRDSGEFELEGDRNERLLGLCRQTGASHYLSGPAAGNYLDEAAFRENGVTVEWMEYGGYPEYLQPHPPFDHYVSVLDLLACTGSDAPSCMLHVKKDRP